VPESALATHSRQKTGFFRANQVEVEVISSRGSQKNR
jgi:hypothetical protein